ERVVAELDLAGLLAALVHREIDDPAEAEGALFDKAQLGADALPRRPGEPLRLGLRTGGKKNDMAAIQTRQFRDPDDLVGLELVRDRATPKQLSVGAASFKEDVSEPGSSHLRFRPGVHPVLERGARPRC